MQKLSSIIENKEQWQELKVYIDLISNNRKLNPNIALDGAKSIMETICKTILGNKGIEFNSCEKLGKLIKDTYNSLPFISYINSQDANNARQILSSFENIAKTIGEFRNSHGALSHGRDIQAQTFDIYLTELVIASSDIISSFLILAHSEDLKDRDRIYYEDYPLFNNYLDNLEEKFPTAFGIEMKPSVFLFYDRISYKEELEIFNFNKFELINIKIPSIMRLFNDDEILEDLSRYSDYFSIKEIEVMLINFISLGKIQNTEIVDFLTDFLDKNVLSIRSELKKEMINFLQINGV